MSSSRKRPMLVRAATGLVILGIVAMSGCGEAARAAASANADEITVWSHLAGNDGELAVVKQIVKDYNASPDKKATIKLETFPQASYNTSVISAATGGSLPCVVDVDQPNVPYWAWANIITPFTEKQLLARGDQLLPSSSGKWNGKVYGFSNYDATVGLFARRSVLKKLGIRVATIDRPWSKSEMEDALAKLKDSGEWRYPFEMGTADTTSEWYAYGFGPILQSFGGDLINRNGYQSADGELNGKKAVEFSRWMRNLVQQGYITTKGASDTGLDFANNKSGLLYGGMWVWSTFQKYAKDIDDIVAMPMTDFGQGSVSPGGSWEIALSKTCANKAAAQDYIRFSLQDKYMAPISKAGMNIPASQAARDMVPEFSAGGVMEIFVEISKRNVKMRPETPAYSFISVEFAKTMNDIINGADIQASLDKAVNHIDGNIKGADGYQASTDATAEDKDQS
ncbi:MAG: extracellular solute-binding protein [Bifidobacterium psychraerophilum]|uniref:sugar ABC transporter substrate-binding protein n=1 Tax=Bifidobacterium psychraerophilum TaxID=218140 RepID=UPI0039EC72C4